MARVSGKKVLSGPSLTRESLLDWVGSLEKKKPADPEARLSKENLGALQALCNNRPVTIRLIKFLKGVPDAEKKAQSFLLSACREHPPHLPSKVARNPSLRSRKLSQIAKRAHILAAEIQCLTMEGIIPAGTDRIEFLMNHFSDPKLLLPPDEAEDGVAYGTDYDEDADGSRFLGTVSVLLESFSDVLEGQAKFVSTKSYPAQTELNLYIDALATICLTHLGRADPTLVANIASVVAKEKFTLAMVRSRIKKLS